MTSDDIRTQQLVLRPGDAGYDEELAGFQTGFAQRPDAIFAATSADDVVAAVAYAASIHVAQINHLGGALSRPAADAVPYRDAEWLARILSPLDGTDHARPSALSTPSRSRRSRSSGWAGP
ncbi:hypothetical protein OG698_30035 [Streptomyces sp. NBC_01003]|uniref:hypothetical protein n=1 Tax=Streptomyces sp. NBC_01003 TaxID=2903714 RepID=UPI003865F232|nr:hypothetical protein OG698_30035 [Streptomyces sp. NBC_01003]